MMMRASREIGSRGYRVRAALICAAALVLVAGCRKKDEVPATTVDTGVATMPLAPVTVAEIEVGKGLNADQTLRDETDDFGVRDTVYAVVRTDGAGTSSQLAAKWTFQDGQTVHESSQAISPAGEARHEFHIEKATAWPKGKYKVEVMLDGVSAGSKEFEIK